MKKLEIIYDINKKTSFYFSHEINKIACLFYTLNIKKISLFYFKDIFQK